MQVENLSKSYGHRTLFSKVSFRLGHLERCAVLGRNGSGKSTLLRIIAKMEESDSGEVCIPKGLRIGVLPQHLKFEQETLLQEALLGLPENLSGQEYRAEKILSGLGFKEEDFLEHPSRFSGGYQLRLALCKVLIAEPDLLLLDEPTNYLDVVSIRWLERYLCSWKGQVLFVSHDRAFINRVATHVLGIHRKQVMKLAGGVDQYYETLSLLEETYEKTRVSLERKKEHLQGFVERFGAKASKASQAQSRVKALKKLETLEALHEENSLDFFFTYESFSAKRLLSIKDLCFSFEERADFLIHGLSLDLSGRGRIAVIGKNGRGKSTILRLLSGELQPFSGEIHFHEKAKLAFFGQTNIERLDLSLTIEEEVQKSCSQATVAEVRQVCASMMFCGDEVEKKIRVLSGGEKSRVLLAKILLSPANLLLLDEPTHHLDMESVEALMQAIRFFPGSVILVSHDESVLKSFCPEQIIVCTKDSQKVFLGNYDLFLEQLGWEEDIEKKKGKKISAKEKRKERAERLQERSKALKPIQREIKKVETEIEKKESKKLLLEEKMLQASQGVDSNMQELTLKHGKLFKEIEALYDELQSFVDQEEILRKQFLE